MTQDRDLGGLEGEWDRDKSLEVLDSTAVEGLGGEAQRSWESDETTEHSIITWSSSFTVPVSLSSPLYLPFLLLSPFLYLSFFNLHYLLCPGRLQGGSSFLNSALHWRGKKPGFPVGSLCSESSAERWKVGKESLVNWGLKVRNLLDLVSLVTWFILHLPIQTGSPSTKDGSTDTEHANSNILENNTA